MRCRTLSVVALLLFIALGGQPLRAFNAETLFAQPLASGTVILAFEERAVLVTGVTPSKQVAWFSIAREPREYYVSVVRREGLAEDLDGDGAVRIELEQELPPRSVWTVVDLAGGSTALARPDGLPPPPLTLPDGGLIAGAGNLLNRFAAEREFLELLLVRPGAAGAGAWGLTVGDGGESDRDGADDGALLAALDEAQAVGTSPPAPPPHLLAGDVLVVIDPRTLEVSLVRLAALPPQ